MSRANPGGTAHRHSRPGPSPGPGQGRPRTLLAVIRRHQGQDPSIPIEIGPGQSVPLTLLQEDSEARPGAVTVNVPEADAARIAAGFGSAEVCVVLGTLEGETYTYTAGTCG